VVLALAHRAIHLGGQHDLLAPAALRQPAPDDLLGHANAQARTIAISGVEEVDPQCQRLIHDREAVGLAGLRSEIHGSQTQPADSQARAAKMRILHSCQSFKNNSITGTTTFGFTIGNSSVSVSLCTSAMLHSLCLPGSSRRISLASFSSCA